ncbi:MAG: long-chain fatty acid--CoA ligase [bacterium]
MHLGDYLARRCVYTPARVALVDAGPRPPARYTYAALNGRANRLAQWLSRNGIEKGDRVAMLAGDGIHYYEAFFACGKLGAVFVPYNWRLHPREVESQIKLTTPAILFHTLDKPLDSIVDHLQKCQGMPQMVPLTDLENLNQESELTKTEAVACESLTETDTACLLFTGGTTGAPKAAQISHRQVVWNTLNALLADVLGSDTFINIFPMFHAGGLFAFSIPLLILGGTVVQTRKFDPEKVLSLIESEQATLFAGVPTTFHMLKSAPNWKKADLSSLRYCLSGGAPLPVGLIKQYKEEKGVVFRQGFGLTEFGPDAFSLASEDAERKAGSIGKPNFFVDARVVDPGTNQPLGSGQVGELTLRGPVATTGYFSNPAATEAAFDSENYFHTGDLAYVDDEGYFFIVDRLKEMYISGGENVYPAEIEAVLYTHPGVEMCAVIGVDDERWGQVGCGFVVPSQSWKPDEGVLLAYLRENLAKYKVPKTIIFRQSLPLSGAGKILKTRLRKLVAEEEFRD